MLKNQLRGGTEQNQLLVPAAVSAHKSGSVFPFDAGQEH